MSAMALVATVVPAHAAEPPTVDWFAVAGARVEDVALDGAGGAAIVGMHKEFGTERSGVIQRYGPNGELLWGDEWTPKLGFVYGLGVAVAPNGTVVAVGGIECEGYEATGAFVRAYTPGGTLKWSVVTKGGWCRDAVQREKATGVAVGHGLVVVVGYAFACCGLAEDDGWIRAYDLDGTLTWRRNFEVPGIAKGHNDTLEGIATTPDGFVVTGSVATDPGHDTATPYDTEIVLQSLDVSGAVLWSTVLRDHGIKDWDQGTDVAVRGGRIIAVGKEDRGWSRPSPERGWIARFTADGDLGWMHRWDADTAANGVSIGPDGTVWVVGEEPKTPAGGSAIRIRAYDPEGTRLWSLRRNPDGRWASATAVAADDLGAFVAGSSGWVRDGGRLWRYVNA